MSATKINKEDLDHIAKLARIDLTESEKALFLPQLESVIEYFDVLNKVDIDGVEPTFRVNEQSNVLRVDEVKESLSVIDALSGAARTKDNYFIVTRTIKNGE